LHFTSLDSPSISVTTLSQQIGETAHCSVLLRKARRLGLHDLPSALRLATARGAHHYASAFPPSVEPIGLASFSHEELVALLLLGEHAFEPFAIRCAAQLAALCDVPRLARLAKLERIARPLARIARAGLAHDPVGADRWSRLLDLLGHPAEVDDGRLPLWSRFVSHSGVTRHGPPRTDWLHARP
jgi:hypothetical protein